MFGQSTEIESPTRVGLLYRVFVFLCVIFLLASPRVVIFEVGGSSVRLEDIVIGMMAIIVALNWKTLLRDGLHPSYIFVLVLVSIVSAIVAQISESVPLGSGLLYGIRPLEYWIIAPFIILALLKGRFTQLSEIELALKVVTILQTGFAVAQYFFNFSVGFSSFSNERGAGLTKGPYELGAIALMLCIYWISRKKYWLASIALIGLLTSLSRVSILAMFVCVLVFITMLIIKSIHKQDLVMPLNLWIVSISVAAITVWLSVSNFGPFNGLLERLGTTNFAESWSRASTISNSIPGRLSISEYMQVAYVDYSTILKNELLLPGASDYVRFFRWNVLINQFVQNPILLIFGLGPSYAGPSVDGSFLRIIVEGGIIGVLAWIGVFRQWFKGQQNWFKYISLSLLVSMLFIDSVYSLRIMVLFWLFFAISKMKESGIGQTPTNK